MNAVIPWQHIAAAIGDTSRAGLASRLLAWHCFFRCSLRHPALEWFKVGNVLDIPKLFGSIPTCAKRLYLVPLRKRCGQVDSHGWIFADCGNTFLSARRTRRPDARLDDWMTGCAGCAGEIPVSPFRRPHPPPRADPRLGQGDAFRAGAWPPYSGWHGGARWEKSASSRRVRRVVAKVFCDWR